MDPRAIIRLFILVLIIAIFARVILTWFPTASRYNPLVALIYQITEPILAPLRKGFLDSESLISPRLLPYLSCSLSGVFCEASRSQTWDYRGSRAVYSDASARYCRSCGIDNSTQQDDEIRGVQRGEAPLPGA